MEEKSESTANAKAKLREPENVFHGYGKPEKQFLLLLEQGLPETVTPSQFITYFKVSIFEMLHDPRPQRFGLPNVLASTMLLNISVIAKKLFGEDFGKAVKSLIVHAPQTKKGSERDGE